MNSKGLWLGAVLAAVLIAPLSAFAQSAQTSSIIGLIAHQANRIDNTISNSTAKMKTFTRGDESGVLSLYSGADNARKLVVQLVSLESGDVTEYYFLNDRLIYVVQACKNFGTGSHNGSLGSCSTISENRFYLSRGNLVAWLRGAGPGPLKMRQVAADKRTIAEKLGQITRSASTWLAFAESPVSDFNRFETDRSN